MSDIIPQIQAIVARISDVQTARRLSDAELIREYPDIGSTKTWRQRLVAGKFEELNLPRMLRNLARVAAILDGGSPDAEYFADLPFAVAMHARLQLLEQQTNDRRILVCLAPNGTGKSAFARWAVAQQRAKRAYIRVRPTWRNKPLHICRGIATAIGLEIKTSNVAEAEDAVITALGGQPRTLFFDQAHEGGFGLLNELRAFVDETPSRFVYLAYETTWRAVLHGTTDAQRECQAFVGRCLKPVFSGYATGTQAKDVTLYLTKVAGMKSTVAESVAVRILPTLQGHTNLRLLEDAIAAAVAVAEDGEIDSEVLIRQVAIKAGAQPQVTATEGGAK